MAIWNYRHNFRRRQFNKATTQRHRRYLPGELSAAAEKVNYGSDSDMLLEFYDMLNNFGGPPIVFLGASHVNHLKSHLRYAMNEDKYYVAFNNAQYIGISGSTWMEYKQHIFGEELPLSQKDLGDQWTPFRQKMSKIGYIAISLGSNDVDQFQSWIFKQHGKSVGIPWDKPMTKLFWRVAQAELRIRYNKIIAKIDELLDFLKDEMPQAKFLYFNILPRCWWGTQARTLARWINYYIHCTIRRRHKVKEVWIREVFESHYQFDEQVMFGML